MNAVGNGKKFSIRLDHIIWIILLGLAIVQVSQTPPPGGGLLNNFPAELAEMGSFRDMDGRFGLTRTIMAIFSAPDIFQPEILAKLRRIAREWQKLPELKSVTSITEVVKSEADPAGGISVAALIPETIRDSRELAAIKASVNSDPILLNNLVSQDGKVALIVASLSLSAAATPDAIISRMRSIVAQHWGESGVAFFGLPLADLAIRETIARDGQRLLPLFGIILIGVILLLRRFWRALLLLLLGLASLGLMAFAAISRLFQPLSLLPLLALLPLISIALLTGGLLLGAFIRQVDSWSGARPPIMAEFWAPIRRRLFQAAILLLPACLLMSFSSLALLRTLGWLMGGLLAIHFYWLIQIMPPLLTHFAWPSPRAMNSRQPAASPTWPGRLPTGMVWLMLPLTVLAGLIWTKLDWPNRLSAYFPASSRLAEATELMNHHLAGSDFILIGSQADHYDNLVLSEMANLSRYLRSQPEIRQVIAVSDVIFKLSGIMSGSPMLPESPEKLRNIWFFLEGEKSLSSLVDDERQHSLMQLRIPALDHKSTMRLVTRLRQYLTERLASRKMVVSLDTLQTPEQLHTMAFSRRSRVMADILAIWTSLVPGRMESELAEKLEAYLQRQPQHFWLGEIVPRAIERSTATSPNLIPEQMLTPLEPLLGNLLASEEFLFPITDEKKRAILVQTILERIRAGQIRAEDIAGAFQPAGLADTLSPEDQTAAAEMIGATLAARLREMMADQTAQQILAMIESLTPLELAGQKIMAEAVRQLCFENFGRRQLVTTEFWQRALQPLGVTGTPFGYTVSLSGFPVIAGVIEAGLQRDIRRFLGLSCLICFLLLLGLQKLLPAAAVISLGTLTAALVGLCAYPLTGFPLDMSAFLLLFTLTGTIGTFFFLTLAWNTPGSQRLIGVAGLGPGLLFVPLLLADLPSTRMIGLIITIGWLTGLGIQQILLPAWLAKLPKIER